MAIFAAIPNPNLFSSLPNTPPPSTNPSPSPLPKPPVPIPKYPPPLKSQRHPHNSLSPAFRTHHRNSKYFRPVKPGQKIPVPESEDRAVIVGESGISYQLPGAPFEFMYSYSETPKVEPVAMREPAFLPFAPPSMPRPWTGKAPMKKSKRKIKLFEPLGVDDSESSDENSIRKRYEMLRDYELGKYNARPLKEVLGAPLTKWEIKDMVKPHLSSNKQVNLGRDGLTHNMLELIHTHWRRQPVCKIRCLGVPTVDMNNVCRCIEEKSGGKIIHRVGGVVYLFRGRNYDHRKRLQLPVMLWKPAAPVYPKLIQDAPEGLTKEAADEFRNKGKKLLPICKLAKNGVYINLVRDVRSAFEGSILAKIDCRGMHPSDYKKIGAKLKELVPCVLLSFDDEQILMWRGKEWKSQYEDETHTKNLPFENSADVTRISGITDAKTGSSSSPKMMALWQRAIESGTALVLGRMELTPDELLTEVEAFDNTSQALEHSYPALIYSSESIPANSNSQHENDDEDEYSINDVYEFYEVAEGSAALGSLPIDSIAEQLSDSEG